MVWKVAAATLSGKALREVAGAVQILPTLGSPTKLVEGAESSTIGYILRPARWSGWGLPAVVLEIELVQGVNMQLVSGKSGKLG